MKQERSVDYRMEKVLGLLERFSDGDFTYREAYDPDGDEIDEIIYRLNNLGEKIQQSGKLIRNYERRVNAIMNLLLSYTLFDFSEKAEISDTGDEMDAIALALNTLGEELKERIETEKKHTARLEQLAVVMETTADGVMLLDPSGIITQWNKSAERIFGHTGAEVVGRSASELLTDPGHIRDVQQLLSRARSGEQVLNYETARLHKNGSEVLLSLSVTPIYRGAALSCISVVIRDITEEKRSQQKLRQSEERFRTLVEGVRDYAIIMLDPAGMVSSWNIGARTIHGYSDGEATGRHYSLFFAETDQQRHVPGNMLKEAIRHGRAVCDLYLVRKDGTPFWANLLVTRLGDNNHHVNGFSLITRDLSEARQKDEEIQRYMRTLEQKNLELEKKNKELSSFAYISSHDLQEPLRKIRTFCSRLLQTDAENLSDRGKEYCHRLEASAQRMQNLIRDIIEYTTLSAGEEKCGLCDLHKIISEVVEEYKEELMERNGRVEVGEICQAMVVERQFRKLMSNLISNSLKFASEKRDPLIRITGETVDAGTGEKHCRVTVRDNGIGFEPHFNTQVFEVFQKLHGQDRYPGTGIGLAVCKKVVENHNGSIYAHGELGKGTTIVIQLPLNLQEGIL